MCGERGGEEGRRKGEKNKENGMGNVVKYYFFYVFVIFLKVGKDNKINNGKREVV